MSRPGRPGPAKLVVGIFTAEKDLFTPALERFRERFGEPDMLSPWFSFHHTRYYEKEMGGPLFRRMAAFGRLADPEGFPEAKLFSNSVEEEFLRSDGTRRLNADPGFLTAERFVLATGKNFLHRIYVGRGIYADLTLLYSEGDFTPLAWTYPDYAERPMRDFLLAARARYLIDRRGAAEDGKSACAQDAGQ